MSQGLKKPPIDQNIIRLARYPAINKNTIIPNIRDLLSCPSWLLIKNVFHKICDHLTDLMTDMIKEVCEETVREVFLICERNL